MLLSAKVQPGNTQIFVNCKWKNPSIRRQALIANRELIQNIQKLWVFSYFNAAISCQILLEVEVIMEGGGDVGATKQTT